MISDKQIFEIKEYKKFNIAGKCYEIDVNSEHDKIIKSILDNYVLIKDLINKKFGDKDHKPDATCNNIIIRQITDYTQYTKLEIYLESINKSNNYLEHLASDTCSICLCELFDNLKTITYEDIIKELETPSGNDAIKLSKCEGHYFHIDCLINFINAQHDQSYIKCPLCCYIYGVMIGDMPEGKMKVYVDKTLHCAGYEGCGTIIIEYNFPSRKRNGKSYYGTYREAYLPDNDEGREILKLLQIAFERKLTFTIGTSVTTGVPNSVIWNGIHHKTCIWGGTSNFGYPDPTYFDRVKLELASKGVIQSPK